MNDIRILTLTQPWATLIALGAKKIETRSWKTNYRGLVAIHAGKGFTQREREAISWGPTSSALAECSITRCGVLPLGQIVAIARLHSCLPTSETLVVPDKDTREFQLGDYSPGRYMWLFKDLVTLPTPIPYKGSQGLGRVHQPVLDDLIDLYSKLGGHGA